jgi:hypothetical protein
VEIGVISHISGERNQMWGGGMFLWFLYYELKRRFATKRKKRRTKF